MTWSTATTLPAAAGQAPYLTPNSGNAGLVILTYFDPSAKCAL
jgi:hypothetical protein